MKRFIFILVSGLLLFGCNNLNEISEVDTPAESGDVHFVTGATAQKIALNFNVPRKDSNLQTRSLSLAADKSIKNVLPYKDENAETVLHIINFDDDDGCALGGHGTAGYITFHMNWGWDGQFDGWYMSHTPNGHNYSNNTKMVSIYS